MTEITLKLLKAAVENVNDSIVITTPDLDAPGPSIIYVNPAFTRMTGYSKEEVIGKNPRFLQGPKTDRHTLDRMRKILPVKHVFKDEITNYRKNGEEYVIEWHISAIKDKDGRIINWVSVQREITERKRLENELRISKEKVEKQVLLRTQELNKAKEKLEDYTHKLESKVKKLEHKEIDMTAKEKKVFTAMMCNPYMNDRQLSGLLNIGRTTITSIRNRLLKRRWLKPIYIPNFKKLGCGIISISFGKDAVSEYSQTFRVLDKELDVPESIFLFSTNQHYFEVSAISKIADINFGEGTVNMPIDALENFLDFSHAVPPLLGELSCVVSDNVKTEKKSVILKRNEKIVLYFVTRYPAYSISRISSVTGLSLPTITNVLNNLIKNGLLQKKYLPSLKLLQKNIFFMRSELELKYHESFKELLNPFISIYYNKKSYIVALLTEEKEDALSKTIDKYYSEGSIKNYPEIILMRPHFIRFHKIEFFELIGKIFDMENI